MNKNNGEPVVFIAAHHKQDKNLSDDNNNTAEQTPKIKRAKIFTRIYEDAIQHVEDIIQGPVNTEKDVRRLFREELQDDEIIKPLKFKGKYGVFWAVCRTDSCKDITGLAQLFRDYFTQGMIRFGKAHLQAWSMNTILLD